MQNDKQYGVTERSTLGCQVPVTTSVVPWFEGSSLPDPAKRGIKEPSIQECQLYMCMQGSAKFDEH